MKLAVALLTLTFAPSAAAWNGVEFLDVTHGFAVSPAPALYSTADGGRHWRLVARRVWALPTVAGGSVLYEKQLARGAYAVVRDGKRIGVIRDAKGDVPVFDVVDARHVFATLSEGAAAGSSAQALYASDDGGRTWRLVSRTDVSGKRRDALPFGCDKSGVGFATPTRGFATALCAGGDAFFYRTDDGGRTWRRLPLRGLARCSCWTYPPRFFARANGAFAVAGYLESAGGIPFVRVYWTRDDGLHWRVTQPPAGRISATVQIPNAHTAWFVGGVPHDMKLARRYVFLTTNGGRTWQRRGLPFAADSAQLDAVDDRTAFAVTPAAIYRTEDGGRTWRGVGPRWLEGLAAQLARRFHDAAPQLIGYAVGKRDVITMRGRFRCDDCSHGPGTPTIRGTRLRLVVDPRTHAVVGLGLR